jgi:YD repeat-containing protein
MTRQPIVVNIPGEGAVEFAYDEEGRLTGKKPVEP